MRYCVTILEPSPLPVFVKTGRQIGSSWPGCLNKDTLANSQYYGFLLHRCSKRKHLAEGKQIHRHLIKSGFKIDLILNNRLIFMYTECRSMSNAQKVFDNMPKRNVVSWTVIIAGYARHGHSEEAVKLFQQMLEEGVMPDKITLISVLSACVNSESLALGKLIHAYSVDIGIAWEVVVGGALVNMFGKCGNLVDARRMFDKMPRRNVVAWNAMIAAYARHGHGGEAFRLLQQMQQEGLNPDKITFISVLSVFASSESLTLGKVVHANICRTGKELDVIVGNALMNMYGKCGSVKDASSVFDNMLGRDVVSWTTIIAVYAQHGYGKEAFSLFWQMQEGGMNPDKITFITVLNACASSEALGLGKVVHAHILRSGLELDVVVGNALVSMYAKCGSIEDAHHMLDKIVKRDVVSWNTIITAYARHGHSNEAFRLFQLMQVEGVDPDNITFVSILHACASLEALPIGKVIHATMVTRGIELNHAVGNTLLSMYSKCGSMFDACRMFCQMPERNVVSWTAMIAGYACHGHDEEAFRFFWQMQEEGVEPNAVTFTSILNACASPEYLALGKMLHAYISNSGMESDIAVENALVSMYFKCSSIKDAQLVFDKMQRRDVVSWTAMITGFAQHSYNQEALALFWQMLQEGVKPNNITFVSILEACASVAALAKGMLVHDIIISSGTKADASLGTSLVKMYGKCGSIEDARLVFDKMQERDVVLWNTMIALYGQHGHGKEALHLFREMQIDGIQPNEITLLGVLCACNHAGLVEEGIQCFNSMNQKHDITPTVEHYNCIIDLLGRAGQLDEAEDFINNMPFQPTVVTWMSFLGSCRLHGRAERGTYAAGRAVQIDPRFTSAYVVLSNLYAAAGRWDDVANLQN